MVIFICILFLSLMFSCTKRNLIRYVKQNRKRETLIYKFWKRRKRNVILTLHKWCGTSDLSCESSRLRQGHFRSETGGSIWVSHFIGLALQFTIKSCFIWVQNLPYQVIHIILYFIFWIKNNNSRNLRSNYYDKKITIKYDEFSYFKNDLL